MEEYQLKSQEQIFRQHLTILKKPGKIFFLKHLINTLFSMKIFQDFTKQKKDKKLFLSFLHLLPFLLPVLGLFGLSAFAIMQR